MRPAALVPVGAEAEAVWVELDLLGATTTKLVTVAGLPVAVRMLVSEAGRDGAVMVLL